MTCPHESIGINKLKPGWICEECGEPFVPSYRLEEAGNRIAAQEDELLQATRDVEVAREALCQIANGIPGPCLHATEALQAIAVERQTSK
jgi:hypothetical protein